MSGFIALHREAFSHPLLKDADRFRAWFWLVAHAAWKPTKHDARGHTIAVDRGQICAGREYLAKEWGWSPSAVERFLKRLETEQMIERQAGQMKTVITICNYDKYQEIFDVPDRNRTETGHESEHMSGQMGSCANNRYSMEKCDYSNLGEHMSGQIEKSDYLRNRTTKEQETNNKYPSDTSYPQERARDRASPGDCDDVAVRMPAKPSGKRKAASKATCERPTDVAPQTWDDFLAMRSRMGAPVSETVVAGFRREADRVGWTLEQAISESVLRSWRGFKADWVKNDDRRHQPLQHDDRPRNPIVRAVLARQRSRSADEWGEPDCRPEDGADAFCFR